MIKKRVDRDCLRDEPIDFPKPIISIIKALSDYQRRRILINLKKKGAMSWREIQQDIDLIKGNLNYHINILEASALIRNFSPEEPTTPYLSYYEITPLAQRVIDGIFNAFRPTTQHITMTQSITSTRTVTTTLTTTPTITKSSGTTVASDITDVKPVNFILNTYE